MTRRIDLRRTEAGRSGALRPASGPDPARLVAGLAVVLLGLGLLLHSAGALTLSFAALAPAVLAAGGAILLAYGLNAVAVQAEQPPSPPAPTDADPLWSPTTTEGHGT